MNKELLFQLYAIHSPSGSEKKMRRFIRKQALECGATSVETDNFGNLLIVKGESETYPCLAAHMDQVQHNHSKDFRVVEIDGDVIGWSPKCHEQQGLGADDKNGIFICLELLRRFPVMKIAFFVQEETGGHGSDNVDMAFFEDCRFVIEPDRKGSSDLITSMSCGQVCSEKFIADTGYADFGYKFDQGTFTDVANLVERGVGISCLNLSCGYYCAHTDHEITVLPHLENCLNFVAHIIETCQEVYPFEYSYGGYGRSFGRHGASYGGYYEDWYCSSKKPVRKKSRQQKNDDYNYYFDGGYFDVDMQTMEEYLRLMPELTFDQVKTYYISDFYASECFDDEEAEDMLSDLYHDAKESNLMYDNSDFWDDGRDDDLAGELVSKKNESWISASDKKKTA